MKKGLKVFALIGIAGWLTASHFVIAPEVAASVAKSGNASNKGYINWCQANEVAQVDKAVKEMRSEVQSQFAEKEAGVVGLKLFGALLNQSFGDRNYQNYIDKYGTNPFDALTGGALSKAPGALGNRVASNKREALQEIDDLRAGLIAQATATCSCAYQAAFTDTHVAWTMWVASATLVQPATIKPTNFRNLAQSKHAGCKA